jgi:hypothetical protein
MPSRSTSPGHLRPPNVLRVHQFVDGEEVALGLGHLAAFHLQEAVVHPHVGHDLGAVGAARLGDLVLVVREDQVDAAAMNVEHLAQVIRSSPSTRCASRDGRVSSRRHPRGCRPSRARRRIPSTGRNRPGSSCVFRPRCAPRPAVRRDCASTGRHRPAWRPCRTAPPCPRFPGDIGVAARDQRADHFDHAADMLGGAGLEARLQAAEGAISFQILVESVFCVTCAMALRLSGRSRL